MASCPSWCRIKGWQELVSESGDQGLGPAGQCVGRDGAVEASRKKGNYEALACWRLRLICCEVVDGGRGRSVDKFGRDGVFLCGASRRTDDGGRGGGWKL